MNVVVGVVVERSLEAAKEFNRKEREKELAYRLMMVQDFGKLMTELDQDGSGELSKEEFLEALKGSCAMQTLIQELALPSGFTVRELFTLIDSSGDGVISPHEFESALRRLLDSSPFQTLCVLLMNINHAKSVVRDY